MESAYPKSAAVDGFVRLREYSVDNVIYGCFAKNLKRTKCFAFRVDCRAVLAEGNSWHWLFRETTGDRQRSDADPCHGTTDSEPLTGTKDEWTRVELKVTANAGWLMTVLVISNQSQHLCRIVAVCKDSSA